MISKSDIDQAESNGLEDDEQSIFYSDNIKLKIKITPVGKQVTVDLIYDQENKCLWIESISQNIFNIFKVDFENALFNEMRKDYDVFDYEVEYYE